MNEQIVPKQLLVTNPYTQKQVDILPLFKLVHEMEERNEEQLGLSALAEKILECTQDLNLGLTGFCGNDIASANFYLIKIARALIATNVLT